MDIAIDSSVLVGLLVPNDLWHSKAKDLWESIKSAGHTGIVFDCVAAETVSTAARRLCEKKPSADVARLLDKMAAQVPYSAVTWILPDVPRLIPRYWR